MRIYSIYDPKFRIYGQVLEGYDFGELLARLNCLPIPDKGIVYRASVPELEACEVFSQLEERGFGGMSIQIGICGGVNDTLNCLEYHKSSELNIAGSDMVLMLGLISDIREGTYHTSKVKAFYVPAGAGVELYGTTLHYAPCGREEKSAFRAACVLPRGTNGEKPVFLEKTREDRMCYGSNKWLLAHPESDEGRSGAYPGLEGENLMLYAGEEI